MRLVFALLLAALVGCAEPDPQAEVLAQWTADSARYAGLDCGMVPTDEGDECRRVRGVLRRRADRQPAAPATQPYAVAADPCATYAADSSRARAFYKLRVLQGDSAAAGEILRRLMVMDLTCGEDAPGVGRGVLARP